MAASVRVAALLAMLFGLCDPAWAADAPLTGDWGGLRSTLSDKGFDFNATYIGETFDNLAGGIHRGAIYEDRLAVSLDVHPGKFSAWKGATLHATMYQIDGHGASANLVGNFHTVSGIEALPSTRLFTLFVEQDLVEKQLSLRLGQLAMDDEFLISANSSNLINATFGNPAINFVNMIAGGPVYPLADPGLRLWLQRQDLVVLAAVFAANPGGSNCHLRTEICDPSGTTFSLSGGTLWLGEVQYAAKLGKGAAALPGTYKLGFWREIGPFIDQHLGLDAGATPVTLASPAAVRPLFRSGDYAFYGVADQMLWKKPGTDDQGLSGFLRLGGAPAADRNHVSFYVDGGLSWKGLVPGRGKDIALLGVAHAAISPAAAALDRDQAALTPGMPIGDSESVVEISYLAQIRSWWTLQPDLQYVIHPGGNVPNPKAPPTPIHDALLLGLRTTITF